MVYLVLKYVCVLLILVLAFKPTLETFSPFRAVKGDKDSLCKPRITGMYSPDLPCMTYKTSMSQGMRSERHTLDVLYHALAILRDFSIEEHAECECSRLGGAVQAMSTWLLLLGPNIHGKPWKAWKAWKALIGDSVSFFFYSTTIESIDFVFVWLAVEHQNYIHIECIFIDLAIQGEEGVATREPRSTFGCLLLDKQQDDWHLVRWRRRPRCLLRLLVRLYLDKRKPKPCSEPRVKSSATKIWISSTGKTCCGHPTLLSWRNWATHRSAVVIFCLQIDLYAPALWIPLIDLLCSSDRICDISLLKLVSSADVCRVLTKVHLVCTASRGHKHKIPSRPTSRRHSPAIKAERARGALSSGCLCYLCVDFPSRVCNV